MKGFLATACAVTMITSAAHASDWKKVAWSVEKQAAMDVDQASLDRTDPVKPLITQRTRTVHGSTTVTVQYDCANRTWSPVSMNGRHTRVVNDAGEDVVLPVEHGSMAEAAYEYACRQPRSVDGPDFRGRLIDYRGANIGHSAGPATH